MPIYKYIAKNMKGRKISSQITAQDKITAISEIKAKNLIPIKLEELAESDAKHAVFDKSDKGIYKYKLKKKKLSIMLNQISVMLRSGVPLPLVMDVLISQEKDKKVKSILTGVNEEMLAGNQLSHAMRRFSTFPPIIISMVEAGEQSGKLDISFERAAIHIEKELEISSKIKGAMAYPIFLLGTVVLVLILISTVIMPVFTDLFEQLDAQLPLITRIVMGFSRFIKNRWYVIVGVIFLIIASYKLLWLKSDSFRIKSDYLKLKIPISGSFLSKTVITRLCRMLELLIEAGVDVVSALRIAGTITKNRYVQSEMEQIIDKVKLGIPISRAMSMHKSFPPLLVSMIRAGEESGMLSEVFGKMAGIYEAETEIITKKLSSLMEPVMTVVIALIVGIIVVSVMMPIYNIYGSIGVG